mmetsp:Transcript_37222/g.37701  ORF Transcript_37222/g.37701 Transcript_37222/m.37701 type:complete len:89 (+) Transcript_37222:201-467(+)
MKSGRLNRYSATISETSQVTNSEKIFAAAMQLKYAIAVNSCSSAILLSLLASGVDNGDEKLLQMALPSRHCYLRLCALGQNLSSRKLR